MVVTLIPGTHLEEGGQGVTMGAARNPGGHAAGGLCRAPGL